MLVKHFYIFCFATSTLSFPLLYKRDSVAITPHFNLHCDKSGCTLITLYDDEPTDDIEIIDSQPIESIDEDDKTESIDGQPTEPIEPIDNGKPTTCAVNSDCPTDETCDDTLSICIINQGVQETCGENSDCLTDEICDDILSICVLSETPNIDHYCNTDTDCGLNEICDIDMGICSLIKDIVENDCVTVTLAAEVTATETATATSELAEPPLETSAYEQSYECLWDGHCLGDVCSSDDECDNEWICDHSICV